GSDSAVPMVWGEFVRPLQGTWRGHSARRGDIGRRVSRYILAMTPKLEICCFCRKPGASISNASTSNQITFEVECSRCGRYMINFFDAAEIEKRTDRALIGARLRARQIREQPPVIISSKLSESPMEGWVVQSL